MLLVYDKPFKATRYLSLTTWMSFAIELHFIVNTVQLIWYGEYLKTLHRDISVGLMSSSKFGLFLYWQANRRLDNPPGFKLDVGSTDPGNVVTEPASTSTVTDVPTATVKCVDYESSKSSVSVTKSSMTNMAGEHERYGHGTITTNNSTPDKDMVQTTGEHELYYL